MSKTFTTPAALLLLVLLFATQSTVLGQAASTPASQAQAFDASKSTLDEHFAKVKKDGSVWQDFQLIKRGNLRRFWSMVADSVTELKTTIATQQVTIGGKDQEISTLNSTITAGKVELAESKTDAASLKLFGISFKKETLRNVFLMIIVALIAAIAYLNYIYRNSNRVTRRTLNDLKSVESELEERKTLHRDDLIKLKRELQTERNALEELKTRSGNIKRL